MGLLAPISGQGGPKHLCTATEFCPALCFTFECPALGTKYCVTSRTCSLSRPLQDRGRIQAHASMASMMLWSLCGLIPLQPARNVISQRKHKSHLTRAAGFRLVLSLDTGWVLPSTGFHCAKLGTEFSVKALPLLLCHNPPASESFLQAVLPEDGGGMMNKGGIKPGHSWSA